MSDKHQLRHALLVRIEQEMDRISRQIDGLLKAMDAVPPAERVGIDWGAEGSFAKRYMELIEIKSEIATKFRLGTAAIIAQPETQKPS